MNDQAAVNATVGFAVFFPASFFFKITKKSIFGELLSLNNLKLCFIKSFINLHSEITTSINFLCVLFCYVS